MLCGCICEFGEDLCLEYHMSFGLVLLPLKLWRYYMSAISSRKHRNTIKTLSAFLIENKTENEHEYLDIRTTANDHHITAFLSSNNNIDRQNTKAMYINATLIIYTLY